MKMKQKKLFVPLLTFTLLVFGMLCGTWTVQAGEDEEIWHEESHHVLVDLDKVKAVDLSSDGAIASKELSPVSVVEETRRVKMTSYGWIRDSETISSRKVSGILLKLTVPKDDLGRVTFTSTGGQKTDIYDSRYDSKETVLNREKPSYTINSGQKATTDWLHTGTHYFWVENDNGTLSIKTESLALIRKNPDKVCVYVWDVDTEQKIEYFYKKYPKYRDKVVCINLGLWGGTSEYVKTIEKVLQNNQGSASVVAMEDEIVDHMLSTQRFTSLKTLGLQDDYENAYDFTKKRGSYKGTEYLAAWKACSGNFLYDAGIAKEVLGTSDPVKVQEMINTPDKFLKVAAKMKKAGYYMTTGSQLYYSGFAGEEYCGIDNVDINICKNLYNSMVSNGYVTKNDAWSDEWYVDLQDPRGRKVFGVFSCTWFNQWTMLAIKDSTLYKNGQSCPGPFPYSWGGTYLGVTKQSTNRDLAALVIKTLCCDEEVMAKMCKEQGEFVNNKNVNLMLAADAKAYSKRYPGAYGGQNLYDMWNQVALAIGNKSGISLVKPLKKGTKVTSGSDTYSISNISKRTVTYTKTKSKKKTVRIPNTVTIRDVIYKVTEVGTGALKGNKKMTKLNVGTNVATIGKNAFMNCTNLKTVNLNSTALKKIGVNAFSGDKKLSTITLKTTKLNGKSVGKNALKGTNTRLVIKAPKKKVSSYKKYFKNKGNKSFRVKK